LSQTLLAVPLCLLFEAGLLFARFFIPQSHYQTEDEFELIEKKQNKD
jgi:sec-independent protein translocase protein TatC